MLLPQTLAQAIQQFQAPKKAAVGFDGYIDRIFQVGRHDEDHRYIETMEQFSAYILEKAGKSCSLNLRRKDEKIGGNMPNYASCLSRLGIDVGCVGALGWPEVHPLFAEGLSGCRLLSVSEPGISDVLEFRDGKVMLAQNGEIDHLDYQRLISRGGGARVSSLFADADLISFLNWSEMREASSIWRGLAEEITGSSAGDVPMLVDFSDCSGKSREAILELTGILAIYRRHFRLYISLNLNEAEQLALGLGLEAGTPEALAERLFRHFAPQVMVIHLVNGCIYRSGTEAGFVPNSMVAEPRILTGGGDNFNAGFSFGILLELEMPKALLLGNAVAGYYVTHGHSPDRGQLVRWLGEYHTTEATGGRL